MRESGSRASGLAPSRLIAIRVPPGAAHGFKNRPIQRSGFRAADAAGWQATERLPLPSGPAESARMKPLVSFASGIYILLVSTVVSLASGIHLGRSFVLMAVLGVALQDAGCDDADVLAHCYDPAPHTAGCWLLDALAGWC